MLSVTRKLTLSRQRAGVLALTQIRHCESFPTRAGMQGFTDARYNDCCDQYLDHIMQVVEELDSPLVNDVDCSAGVLTIDTKNGTFIINKQAPKLQLWLSSPISGAHHYDMVEKTSPHSEPVVLVGGVDVSKYLGSVVWLSDKDKHSLTEKLEKELSKCIEFEVRL